MTRKLVSLALAVFVLLGCGGGRDTRAQDKPGGPDVKADPKPEEKPADKPGDKGATEGGLPAKPEKGDKPVVDDRRYTAVVSDRFNTPDFQIDDAVIWVPEVSILGGEGGTPKRELFVKLGAAEITVPFAEIAWIEFKDVKEDRLEVAVKRLVDLKSEDPKVRNKVLAGTIKSNLQLHGKYENTNLSAVLKLRELTKIVLQPHEK